MKKTLLASAILAMALPSMAIVTITWNTLGATVTTDGATPAPTTYWAQLIWSPVPVITIPTGPSPLAPDAPVSPGMAPTSEVALRSVNLLAPGFIATGSSNYDDAYAGGYVYTRVFDSSSPTTGSLFGNSVNISGPLTITTSDPTTATTHNPSPITVNQVVAVPEPSVFGLFVIGLGFLGRYLRRK